MKLILKSRIKAHTRTDSKTGKVAQVREHEDSRIKRMAFDRNEHDGGKQISAGEAKKMTDAFHAKRKQDSVIDLPYGIKAYLKVTSGGLWRVHDDKSGAPLGDAQTAQGAIDAATHNLESKGIKWVRDRRKRWETYGF